MRSPVIATIIFLFALALGFGGGYFVQKARTKPVVIDKIMTCPEQTAQAPAEDRTEALKRINLKLDLLRKYLNHTMLPKSSIEDPVADAKEIRSILNELSDPEITDKFALTMESADQKSTYLNLLGLYNTIIDKVKAEAR